MSEIKFICYQICAGLLFIHQNNFIHRDFKSANILLNKNLEIRICDFGLARYHNDGSLTPGVVTLWYRAPELILGSETYDKSIDVWGLGCIFGELLLGKPMMKGKGEIEQLEMIVYMGGSINEKTYKDVEKLPNYKKVKLTQSVNNIYLFFKKYDNSIVEVIYRCLNVDPSKRILIEDIFDMKFFREDDKEPIKRLKHG